MEWDGVELTNLVFIFGLAWWNDGVWVGFDFFTVEWRVDVDEGGEDVR